MKKILIVLVLVLLIFNLFTNENNETNLHDKWDIILEKYNRDGKFYYGEIINNLEDLNYFYSYTNELEKTNISNYNDDDKMAFLINLYNAFTVKLILDNYGVKSIRDIRKPWKKKIINFNGSYYSLDDIEHGILRKDFKEPRIHFAVNCASIGCPVLYNKAFRPELLEEQLTEISYSFFLNEKDYKIDVKNNRVTVYLNKIFNWYGEDFGKTNIDIIEYIKKYIPEKDKKILENSISIKIKYLFYDWNLNGS